MIFLAPGMLWGLVCVSVPVIIYLLFRHRVPSREWGAMELLARAFKKAKRRHRLRTLILLAVRMVLIALLVATLARPTLRSIGWLRSEGRERSAAVFVLDGSFSMTASVGVGSVFQQAKDRAAQILAELAPGSAAAVILASNPPQVLVEEPSRDLEQVSKVIAEAQPAHTGTNLPLALRSAEEILQRSSAPNQEVFIVTDGQRAGLEPDREAIDIALRALEADRVNVLVFLVAPGAGENLAVTGIHCGDEVVTPRWPARFEGQIRNFGATGVTDVPVDLWVGSTNVDRRLMTVPAGEERVVTFEHRFIEPGDEVVSIRLGEDSVAVDNVRYRKVRVVSQLRLLIVEARGTSEGTGGAGSFLEAAVEPGESDAGGVLRPRVVDGAEVASADLSEIEVVLVVAADRLTPADWARLLNFVESGGGLWVFLPASLGAEGYAGLVGPAPDSVVPARILEAKEGQTSLVLSEPIHPALRVFADATLRDELPRVLIRPTARLEPVPGSGVESLVGFGTGSPAMLLARRGKGTVIVAAFPADRQGSNLPLSPAFVPLVHELVFFTQQAREEAGEVRPGDPIIVELPAPGGTIRYTLRLPEGGELPVDEEIESSTDGTRAWLRYPETFQAGVYTVIARSDTVREIQLPVNPDPPESDPSNWSEDEIMAAFPSVAGRTVSESDNLRVALREGRFGRELWSVLILVLLGWIALEQYLAHRFSPRSVDAAEVFRDLRSV